MKLIKQAILTFRQGKSDKVYEIDLCEVGTDRYVVNFRYGRRGSALREGTKTATPVPRAKAEAVFAQQVAAKTKKGYTYQDHTSGGPGASTSPASGGSGAGGAGKPSTAPGPHALGPREQAILERLRRGDIRTSGSMKLDRAIWRAGELDLAAAVPELVTLWRGARRDQRIRRYSIAWALGRCGAGPGADTTICNQAVSVLEEICDATGEPEHVRHIAMEGLRRLYQGERRAAMIDAHIERLPEALRELARKGPAAEFASALAAAVQAGDKAGFQALWRGYLIDNEHVRPGLLQLLASVPLTKGYFARLRQIFKAAEFRRDGQVFGLIAYRFEKTPAQVRYWYTKRDPTQPFFDPTRQYMRRRVWRTLRRLGQDMSPDYVKMAAGVLLPFTDADARPIMRRRYYRWRKPDINVSWDIFASYWAFNHVLYGQSPRYYPDENSRAWRCRETFTPGTGKAPEAREESFPGLWEKTPQALLHLVDESQCERVHEFAVKALRACPEFLARLDASVVVMLVSRPYDVTALLGLDLAQALYRGQLDDNDRRDILLALVECRVMAARAQARTWIDVDRLRFGSDTRLMAALATSSYADNREYARALLRTALLGSDAARVLIARLIAAIKDLGEDENERIADIATTLMECFASQLSSLGIEVIRDLLDHPAAAAQELAGRLLLGHSDLARKVPDRLLFALLDSRHESVRSMGAQLLGRLGDSDLARHHELLVLLTVHEHADLRAGVRPVIRRLAAARSDFAATMVDTLVTELMRKHPRGVHSHILQLLQDDLAAHLDRIPKERVWQLLHHKHPHAQELGGVLLGKLGADDLSVAELVKLVSHEILAVRNGAWDMCEKAVDRLERAMPTAVRLLDAKWDDSRQRGFAFFRTRISRDALTPDILVAICDSVRPDVQQFGRELINTYFRDQDGETYLLRLGEHPSEALQLFASNYLETYAAGQPERIAELEPYFLSVLSRVNKGRVSKQRCIAFLQREAVKNRAIAEVAARIFARQSATMAIGDREAMIKAMVDIARAHSDLSTMVQLRDVELRNSAAHDMREAGDGV